MEKYYLAALQHVFNLSEGVIGKLLDYFKTGENIWQVSPGEIKGSNILSDAQFKYYNDFHRKNTDFPKQLAEKCQKLKIRLTSIHDEDYPPLLKEIFFPPYVLFYRGTLQNDLPRLAMVGSRKITPYGRAAAEKLGRELASQGVCIISGAAYGVDTECHKSALSTGITEAVLGCGVDIAYPSSNRKLLDEIAEKGAVLSEYVPGTPPIKTNFPARNRIIAGMAMGILVIEAMERSGSLITVEHGINANRDIFAVPGSIFSPSSLGCNKLIQQGAKLVLDSEDIISEYRDKIKIKTLSKKNGNIEKDFVLSAEEERIYAILKPDIPLSVDDIIYKLHGSSPANVAFLLLQMELRGLVRSNDAHYYRNL